MDPTLASVITIASTIVSALFGALMFSMRGQITDWRELYRQEKKDHNDTRTSAAAVNSQNSESLRQLSATLDKVSEMLKQFPRRREDWEQSGERR